MSAEARLTMAEVWAKWEGQIINGVFPLRRFLNGSDHSGVYLTEYKAQNLPNAALKLVPAIPTLTEAQLSHWRTAASLSHPHLVQLLEAGRCQLGGLQFLFIVMEYAEQTLSQILPERALTPGEAREMLPLTLDALAFLHGRNLVQGQLKPANILVVNDQLKLASDTVRPAGESTASIGQPSMYDPPEAEDGSFSAAGDIWGLGVTLAEALTQQPPSWPDRQSAAPSLPATLPPTFVEIVRQCLDRNPAKRPTVADLKAWIKPAPQAPAASVPRPVVDEPFPFDPAPPARESPKQRSFVPVIAGILTVLIAVWAGQRLLHRHPNSEQPAASTPGAAQKPGTPVSAPPEVPAPSSNVNSAAPPARPVPRSSEQRARPSASASPFVLHKQIPDVPRSARETIHGHVRVAVRVTIDSSGNVVDTALENPGPSRYFARLANEAAKKWKFAPADRQKSRKRLLRFEFGRGGTAAQVSTPRS